ncbi:DNA (cytosine-5)-methyltransferase 3 [Cyphellophora attinorum]|uniref:DNA (cytosine-5-)-methyltransferase n=1 Tax=Cyphellophora attinorum TaxID=1664694 RepID=A0A0N1P081_9EURO|nr:DNA (cytosine-5)-methyltransferase 3 [Phialophora attinorum]KPI43140.1 DNA (cytosine-5)-methyltransferase 3 [Phialophora attinorum]
MAEEEDIIEVVRPAATDDDDEPLAFNGRRATTAPLDSDPIPTIELLSSNLPGQVSNPSRSACAYIPVSYEVDSEGNLIDIFLPRSKLADSTSPKPSSGSSQGSTPSSSDAREQFRHRRNNLTQLSERMKSISEEPDHKLQLPVRQATPADGFIKHSSNSRASVVPDRSHYGSERWESESLNGFIVSDKDETVVLEVSDDDDDDDGFGSQPQRAQPSELLRHTTYGYDQHLADSPSPAASADSTDKDDHYNEAAKLLRQIENPEDLASLYPASLQVASVASDEFGAVSETELLKSLLPGWPKATYVDLRDFSIYQAPQVSGKGYGGQLTSLFTVIKTSMKAIELDSVLVGGLDDPSSATTTDDISIITSKGREQGIEYRLINASRQYTPLFESFLWVADFTKHVFRFLQAASERRQPIHLANFTNDFWQSTSSIDWAVQSNIVNHWHKLCDNVTDFRRHFIHYGSFLYERAAEVAEDGLFTELQDHPLWEEIGLPKPKAKQAEHDLTTVTEDVATAFLPSFPTWGSDGFDLLEVLAISLALLVLGKLDKMSSRYEDGFTDAEGSRQSKVDIVLQEAAREADSPDRPELSAQQTQGRVIIVKRHNTYRYAYVKDVNDNSVNVLWLLQPKETICGSADEGTFYPIGNELFFSDECCCDPIACRDVLAAFEASVPAEQGTVPGEFFVHMLYRTQSQTFHTADLSQIYGGCLSCDTSISDTHQKEPYRPRTPKLNTLSLFSGCGILDHALASTSYFETSLAIEINQTALLSHKVNESNTNCRYHHGSTNTYLKELASGRKPYDRFNFLVAGCPCQGFSRRNPAKHNKEGQRNCSMLANTLSYVDLLRLEYVLIENVESMNSKQGKVNACAQAICSLVSMGYQVRKMVLKGGDFNAATKRTRLFLIAAAPGLVLPAEPSPVQSDDPQTAWSVIEDLPPVHNDDVINLHRPDHVPFERLANDFDAKVSLRGILKRVPVTGEKRNLYGAWDQGHLNRRQVKWFGNLTEEKQGRGSTTLQRVNPEGLFPTITRLMVPLDSRGSPSMHPFQHRTLTLEELRRAQGLRDDFLLIGSVADVISQIGNGVVWQVAQALGRSIGEAWAASQPRYLDEDVPETPEVLKQETATEQDSDEQVTLATRVDAVVHVPQLRSNPPEAAQKRKIAWRQYSPDRVLSDNSDDEVQFLSERRVRSSSGKSDGGSPPKKAKTSQEESSVRQGTPGWGFNKLDSQQGAW